SLSLPPSFFSSRSAHHPDLPSFPTRRSSDLVVLPAQRFPPQLRLLFDFFPSLTKQLATALSRLPARLGQHLLPQLVQLLAVAPQLFQLRLGCLDPLLGFPLPLGDRGAAPRHDVDDAVVEQQLQRQYQDRKSTRLNSS